MREISNMRFTFYCVILSVNSHFKNKYTTHINLQNIQMFFSVFYQALGKKRFLQLLHVTPGCNILNIENIKKGKKNYKKQSFVNSSLTINKIGE